MLLTDSDQTNILASLVATSLECKRIVTRIHDPKYEFICSQLGLTDIIVPHRTISRYLVEMTEGIDVFELSTAIKGNARLFTFDPNETIAVEDLELPASTRAICLYRDDELVLPEDKTKLSAGDEVVVLTTREHLGELKERWGTKLAENR